MILGPLILVLASLILALALLILALALPVRALYLLYMGPYTTTLGTPRTPLARSDTPAGSMRCGSDIGRGAHIGAIHAATLPQGAPLSLILRPFNPGNIASLR